MNDNQTPAHERYTIRDPATGQILVTTASDATHARMQGAEHWPDADPGWLIVRTDAESAELEADPSE